MNDRPSSVARRLWRAGVFALRAGREACCAIWRLARGPLLFTLELLAALILLFEEWGWKPLSEALARLARYAPIARIERWIAALSPYPALLVFTLPTVLLAPLKLLAVWLLATGNYWTATGLFVAAKIAATALVARLFTLTQPSLMRIAWFARAYHWFVPWKDAFFTMIRASRPWRFARMLKNRVKQVAERLVKRARQSLAIYLAQSAVRDRLPAKWRRVLDVLLTPPPGN